MQASKWLQLQALLSFEEMEKLFETLGCFRLFLLGQVVSEGKGEITKEDFLNCYRLYASKIAAGEVPDASVFRSYFSSALTVSDEDLFSISAGANKQIFRSEKPFVQMQLHTIGYSPIEGKFRPMIMGKESIHWGIQFSYPQLFLDPETKAIEKAMDLKRFPNAEIFRKLQKWIRDNTLPTPFQVGEMQVRVPMRLGKECFLWINQHSQLKALGVKVSEFPGGRNEN